MAISRTVFTGGFSIVCFLGLHAAFCQHTGRFSSLEAPPPGVQRDRLVKGLWRLDPWQSADYSRQSWSKQILLARQAQRADRHVVAAALGKFVQQAESRQDQNFQDTKAMLLLRVMFVYPEDAPDQGGIFQFGKIWGPGPQPGDGPDVRPLWGAARVNLGWPVSWQGGRPHLTAHPEFFNGVHYAADGEYAYALKHFPLRDLHDAEQSLTDTKTYTGSRSLNALRPVR